MKVVLESRKLSCFDKIIHIFINFLLLSMNKKFAVVRTMQYSVYYLRKSVGNFEVSARGASEEQLSGVVELMRKER